MTATQWVVFCETHKHELVRVAATGTTWTDDRAKSQRFDTKPAAKAAADKATWLDHRPIVWAVADESAEL